MTIGSGLSQAEVTERLKQHGYNEVPDKRVPPLFRFLSKFWGLSAWMLELIIILSWFLQKYSDAYVVAGLLFFNSIVSFIQEQNAANAVAALKQKLQINVKALRNGKWGTVPARELVPDDVVRVRMGDFVPADIKIIAGEIYVDQSALTGESGTINRTANETVYAGAVVTRGEATGMVSLTGADTYFGKTVQLVKTARPKSHIDEVVSNVTKWLLAIVATLLLLAFVVSVIRGVNLIEVLPLMLVLLLGAIPVALSAMFTVSMALGSKELVRQGVLVTRLNAPDDAARMDVLCVDKTGTLTVNKLSVAAILPSPLYTESDILLYGALASQEANNDAIDVAIINAAKQKNIRTDSFVQKSFMPFDAQTRKTQAIIQKGNEEFTVIKGAFNVIARECALANSELAYWAGRIDEFAKEGYRTLAVAVMQGKTAVFMGIIALHDPPRADSLAIIRELKNLGISIKMLTGDALPIAKKIATTLEIGDAIFKASELREQPSVDSHKATELLEESCGFAEVYPEDKYNIVKALQAKGHIVGMTGDGVNDSPALKQAEVGIAVSNASDVAKGAASIVLMREGLSNILAPIQTGRMMFQRISNWILNKITRTILYTCFVVVSFLTLGKYVISAFDMLVMIFMVDFVIVSLSTDNVQQSKTPDKWNVSSIAKTGMIIGLLMSLEALGLLYIGLNYFHLANDTEALNTFCFETLLFFALVSVFVVREKGHFWHSAPGKAVLYIVIADIVIGIVFSTFGMLHFKAIPLIQSLFIAGYALISSLLVNDTIKVFVFKRLSKNINGIINEI